MNEFSDEAEAGRWEREAGEELRAAQVIAEHSEVPDRVAGLHAHLAAEKAMKALLIRRGVVLRRSMTWSSSSASFRLAMVASSTSPILSCSIHGPSMVGTPPTSAMRPLV